MLISGYMQCLGVAKVCGDTGCGKSTQALQTEGMLRSDGVAVKAGKTTSAHGGRGPYCTTSLLTQHNLS